MRDHKATKTGLILSWVPVRDANGRVRMEAHWTVQTGKTTKPRPHVTHAA
ncbi:MAG TPA: hypothetical protein VEK80_04870 [Kribbellaceae bacterium]|nr:hypothetical protein [Kribbellaceae bacterium]